MALGDGIRRNIATVSQEERNRFRDAIVSLDKDKLYGDGVSYWDKQEDIHKNAHAGGVDVHGGPAFVPWHRELCNRFEMLLREVDPELSLHYWDWTTDPRDTNGINLFTSDFMGNSQGEAGEPFEDFATTGQGAPDAADPNNPMIWRDLTAGSPENIGASFKTDVEMVVQGDGEPQSQQFFEFREALESMHNDIHSSYIGGTIGNPHFSFEDPFVFLLHSNVDRLFAAWQMQDGKEWRLDPDQVYGSEGTDPTSQINKKVEPWAGNLDNPALQLRPWAPPENQIVNKTYKHPSIIRPPCYDSVGTKILVANLGNIINFNDVPEDETAIRAAVFHVYGCTDVTLRVKAGTGPSAPYSVFIPPGTTTPAQGEQVYAEARIWFAFTGTHNGGGTSEADGSVTIECPDTGDEFELTLKANTIDRPTVGVALALDQSGSMDDPAGSLGAKRVDVLKEAAGRFVSLIQAGNAVGIVRFDTDAYPANDPTFPGLPMTTIGPGGDLDPARGQALGAVGAHTTNPAGATSIGDGVEMARNLVNTVSDADFPEKALIVFTDGLENRPQSIAQVMGSIDQQTFAIGLGTESQVSMAALTALANGTGGYLLLTGHLTPGTDEYFRLSKFFLQILAAVTNTEIVVDPSGFIAPGTKLRIPYILNEADIDATAVLMTDMPVVRMSLETPAGDVITPAMVAGLGGLAGSGVNMNYIRLNLPVAVGAGAHAGTWHAILEVEPDVFKRYLEKLREDRVGFSRAQAHGARFSFLAQSFSNLRMTAQLSQNSLEPGATMTVRAVLTEYGVPVEKRGSAKVELTRPDGTTAVLTMAEVEPGVFQASLVAPIQGVYRFRVMAAGVTFRGMPFTREQLLTGAVVQGGDGPFPGGGSDPTSQGEELCRLLMCLGEKGFKDLFKKHGIDQKAVLECLEAYCRRRNRPPNEGRRPSNATVPPKRPAKKKR